MLNMVNAAAPLALGEDENQQKDLGRYRILEVETMTVEEVSIFVCDMEEEMSDREDQERGSSAVG
jgi:hypothetical protein